MTSDAFNTKRQEDQEIIDRAKCLLIRQLCMSEPEAHRYIARQAMDTCRTRRVIAENIVRTYELSYAERWNQS